MDSQFFLAITKFSGNIEYYAGRGYDGILGLAPYTATGLPPSFLDNVQAKSFGIHVSSLKALPELYIGDGGQHLHTGEIEEHAIDTEDVWRIKGASAHIREMAASGCPIAASTGVGCIRHPRSARASGFATVVDSGTWGIQAPEYVVHPRAALVFSFI